jgi:ParB family chromosome partitioning protein
MTVKRRGLGRGFEALIGASAISASNFENKPASGEQLAQLPIDKIRRGPYQPRVHFEAEALQNLADSIRAQGILQPIVVRVVGDGYELIAGERRWRAAQLAELQQIPAIIKVLPDEAVAAVALIENIQRENLNPLEEANALQRLINEFEMTHQQIADSVGRSRAAVSNLLRLLELGEDVKKHVDTGKLSMGHARAMLGMPERQQRQLANEIIAKDLSVRETEKRVRTALTPAKPKAEKRADPDIARLEQELSDRFGAKVQIDHSNSGKGKLVLFYRSSDEFEGILKKIR